MGKSDVRKVMLGTLSHTFPDSEPCVYSDTLHECNKRKNEPARLSAIDGSVLLVQILSSSSNLPDPVSIDEEEFEKSLIVLPAHLQTEEDVKTYTDITGTQGLNPFAKMTARRAKKRAIKECPHSFRMTWQSMVMTFERRIVHELQRLTPHKARDGRSVHPVMVVLGFDKMAEEIKSETQAKRRQDRQRAIERQTSQDIADGFEPTRGIPVDWETVGSSSFSLTTALPYPHMKVMQGDNKAKVIRFVCRELIRRIKDGRFLKTLEASEPPLALSAFTLVLDGHCLYPEDDEDLRTLQEKNVIGDAESPERKMKEQKRERLDDLSHGARSFICDTPVSIHVMIDNQRVLHKRLNSENTSPWEQMCIQACTICSETIKLTYDAYYSVIVPFPRMILRHVQKADDAVPHQFYFFKDNDVGEFDYTTFHYITGAKKRLFDWLMVNDMSPDPARFEYGARIVTVDTDAFVLSALSIERARATHGERLFIHLVNNHSGNAYKKRNEKMAPADVARSAQRPPDEVYAMHRVCRYYKEMFPTFAYPTASLAFALYYKENDYLSLSLSGASIETMFKSVRESKQHIGANLFINPHDHPRAWRKNGGEDVPRLTMMIDRERLFTFVNDLVDFIAQQKKGGRRLKAPSAKETVARWKKMTYIVALYVDSVSGYANDRSIPPTDASSYGF